MNADKHVNTPQFHPHEPTPSPLGSGNSLANRQSTIAAVICTALLAALALFVQIARAADSATYSDLEPNKFLKTWLILGPVPVSQADSDPDDAAQRKAFESDLLARAGGEAQIHATAGAKLKLGDSQYAWKLIHSPEDIVDLTAPFGSKEFVTAYAYAEIEMPEASRVLAGLGSDDAVKVWLNGKLAHENLAGRPARKDEDLVQLDLQRGKNRLLLKVQNARASWGFVFRRLGEQSLADKLVGAAATGDAEALQKILARGVSVNRTNKVGLSPLHAARTRGYTNVVEMLLAKGADPNAPIPTLEQWLDAGAKDVVKGLSPGAAMLVAKAGKILLKRGYGYASLEHRVPITPETKFRIGSISKQFTASAILKLQEQGKLSVSDKLSKFIPDYPRGDEVTIHHLLTHTSGIHSYTSKPDFFETVTVPVKPEDLIKSFKNDPYDFAPGEKWSYNNSGYFLLGAILEKVAGASYGDFLKQHFFEPLGMNNTGVHNATDILEHEATGYTYERGAFKKALDWNMSRAGGAGALYSTVEDLFKWNEALFNGKVLGEATLKAAFTPVKTAGDLKSGGETREGYGYGWAISQQRGLTEIAHGGGLQGFLSYLLRFPKENFTVVVLANAAAPPPGLDPTARARDIAEMALWKNMEPRAALQANAAVSPKGFDAIVGRYDYSSAVLEVTREGDRLFAQLTGQPKFQIFPKSETEFFWKIVDAQVTFVKNDNGEVTKAIHRQGGLMIDAARIKDAPMAKLAPEALQAYVGKYDYGQGKSIMRVTREGARLFAQLTGQPKFEIFPKSETEFFWKSAVAEVKFVKDGRGKVIKATHSQGGRTFDAPRMEEVTP
ncbi:MAG: DUF3471 domain-containing protein [Verrucomicrobia bacterium]|nr:DUF3471 domain-containing protein [Verrucomicrobiota bacterium]